MFARKYSWLLELLGAERKTNVRFVRRNWWLFPLLGVGLLIGVAISPRRRAARALIEEPSWSPPTPEPSTNSELPEPSKSPEAPKASKSPATPTPS